MEGTHCLCTKLKSCTAKAPANNDIPMAVHIAGCENLAESQSETCTLHYIGGAVTGLMGTQISLTTVRITWTPPAAPPQNGYETAIGSATMPTNFVDISAPPHNRTVSGTGVRTIVLRSVSVHYPTEDMSAVTVLGERS